MTYLTRVSLTRRRLGVIAAAVLCAVLLSICLSPAAPGADVPGSGKVAAADVDDRSPDTVAPAPATSSYETTVAIARAEQQLESFSSSLAGVLSFDEIDSALFVMSIEEDPATQSLEDLERDLFGAGSMLFASTGDLPETPFFSDGRRLTRTPGLIGLGGFAGGGSGGDGSSGGSLASQDAIAANRNNPNGGAAGNGPGNHSGDGPGSNPGSSDGNSGQAGGGSSSPVDESQWLSGPGSIDDRGPSDERINTVNVPEPSVLSLVVVGLAGFVATRRRRARRTDQ